MAIDHPLQVIDQNSPSYPILLSKRLGKEAPVRLWAIGRLNFISIPKTAPKTIPVRFIQDIFHLIIFFDNGLPNRSKPRKPDLKSRSLGLSRLQKSPHFFPKRIPTWAPVFQP